MTEDDPEDQPTEAELELEAHIDRALVGSSDAARREVEDCHEAFGYGIPTVVLGQVGRWFWKTASSQDLDEAQDATRTAEVLSGLFEEGDELMRTIIATGFLEALPQPQEHDRDVVERLPPPLREELRRMESWTPS